MAKKTQISVKIDCNNLAPITSLSQKIAGFQRMKLGIYANNGSGKTFISRMFSLAESKNNLAENCDKYISFGKDECGFRFQVYNIQTEDDGHNTETIVDDLNVKISRGKVPIVSEHKYKYHVFNSDYIDRNVRQFSYAKEGDNITGFILGEGNIDVQTEKEQLKILQDTKTNTEENISNSIKLTLEQKVDFIKDIKRIREYQDLLTYNSIIEPHTSPFAIDISYDSAYSQYDLIKNFPDNILDIQEISSIIVPTDLIKQINNDLMQKFELSSLAVEFKEKVKSKYDFVTRGIELLDEKNQCPFCEQDLSLNALSLIDDYNHFLKDIEAKTIKKLEEHIRNLEILSNKIKNLQNSINSKKIEFDNYILKYIFSMRDVSLEIIEDIDTKNAYDQIDNITDIIKQKIKNINQKLSCSSDIIQKINTFNNVVVTNNGLISQLNRKKNDINEESKTIRRIICKLVYNELLVLNQSNKTALLELTIQIKSKEDEIKTKLATIQLDRKEIVAKTIKKVLKYFFSNKYTFDESSFSFFLKDQILDSSELSSVFSDGEKSLVAFAYYLGDVHLKIQNSSEYKDLFFIIDDPISSLDFNYVYTMGAILKDLSILYPEIEKGKERLIVLTHNLEFMRILSVNEIVAKKLFLRNGTLKNFNTNFTIPYIEHLCDVYEISKERQSPSHTTANSIRHIIETIIRFENCSMTDSGNDTIYQFMKDKFEEDIVIYTFMQDLSHGAYRPEQPTLTEEQYVKACGAVVELIQGRYEGQIKFIEKYEKARV